MSVWNRHCSFNTSPFPLHSGYSHVDRLSSQLRILKCTTESLHRCAVFKFNLLYIETDCNYLRRDLHLLQSPRSVWLLKIWKIILRGWFGIMYCVTFEDVYFDKSVVELFFFLYLFLKFYDEQRPIANFFIKYLNVQNSKFFFCILKLMHKWWVFFFFFFPKVKHFMISLTTKIEIQQR